MASRELPIDCILIGRRLRPVDEAGVAGLVVSMQESEQLQGILVRPAPEAEPGEELYELVIGAHRHAAVRRLGWPTIRGEIRHLTDAQARLIEADENLIRGNLNPLDRAVSIAARLDAWAECYPDRIVLDGGAPRPKRGPRGVSDTVSVSPGAQSVAMGFAAETAADLNLSEKTIRRALAVFRGISEASREGLAGSWVARSEGVLRQLAALASPDEQAAVLRLLLEGRTKSVSEARAIAAGNAPVKTAPTALDDTLKAFRTLWGKASPSGRGAILEDLAGRTLPDDWRVSRS